MSPPRRKRCPACKTPIRKDDPVRRGRHADCDTYEPQEHRSPSNTTRYDDNREAYTVTGRRNHEQFCFGCGLLHAGGRCQ